MCGIIGYSLTDESLKDEYFGNTLSLETTLSQNNDLMTHRGPDDKGTFYDHEAGIGLGHRRLAIIDISVLGRQPMGDYQDKIKVVFNGEIYNFKDLREELIEDGVKFNSNSDTEVIVYLYKKYGQDMLDKLNGIFSIAIWDRLSEELFIARDNLGVKPLYFLNDSRLFAFASELKALINFTKGPLDLDLESTSKYLTYLWCPGSGTPIERIKKLEPGYFMKVKKGEITDYKPWYSPNIPSIKYRRKGECIRDLDESLRSSIHRQMISDVEVGAFLSGGLDSSSVVSFAKEINPNIKCFTIRSTYEDGVEADLPYAQKVAEHLNVPLYEINVTPDMMVKELEEMVIQLDEPLADLAPLNVKFIAKAAREHNIKVLLSGAGGDDIFTGYRRHVAIMLDNYLKIFPNKALGAFEKLSSNLYSNNPFSRRLSKFLDGISLEGDERIINYFAWTSRNDLINLFSNEALSSIQNYDPSSVMQHYLDQFDTKDNLERMLALEQRFFLTDHNLLYTDKMSMSEGVEVRVPLLDKELLLFSKRIPNKWKQRGKEGKWIFKKVMENYLPREIIYRPKTGFGVPLRNWLRGELKEYVRDTLSEETINKRGIFNFQSIQNMVKQNETGMIDSSYTILSLICIEIWCKNYLDNNKLN
jgi:asparagine synthase (glutamine-hydrolysing)